MTTLEDILASYKWFDHQDGPKFVETHRDQFRTSGHWLFVPGAISFFHKASNNDELWYIHSGRLVIHLLTPGGVHETVHLGVNMASGERPVAVVPASCWQAAEIPDGEPFAFGTNVCAPPFSYGSFVLANRAKLLQEYPQHADLIHRFTRLE